MGMTPREQSQIAAKQFKDRLKAARKQARLTQDELVAMADISAVTLSKLETGVNKPAFDVFVALAYALDVSPNFLVGWYDDVKTEDNVARRQLISRLHIAIEQLSNEWLEQLLSISEMASNAE